MVADSAVATDRRARQLHLLRRAGAVVQGLVLGLLLPLAVMELAALAGSVGAFKYQGF
jgi:hypothetical protein